MSINTIALRITGIFLLLISFTNAQAQTPPDNRNVTESGDTMVTPPLDDIYDKLIIKENNIQYYSHLNERDILWEKRVLRTVDIKEKRNQTFARVDDGNFELGTNALITILLDEAKKENFIAYSDENFKNRMDMTTFGSSVDTTFIPDPVTGVLIATPVVNSFNAETIKQFRIKEVWFFDEEQSDIGVRILGFAPVGEIQDNTGIVISTTTLFWVYYPEIRPILAKHRAFSDASDSEATSWEAIFEKRLFSSYIIKESNVHDRRIEHYKSGMDIFYESNSIKDTHFHFEHDQWDY